jgi:hypothetical protein
VQPARKPASSLMNTLAVMCGSTVHCMAFPRFNTFPVVYSHAPDGRGHCGHWPRPEQVPLNPISTAENASCCGSVCRHCTGETSRQQGAMNGSA